MSEDTNTGHVNDSLLSAEAEAIDTPDDNATRSAPILKSTILDANTDVDSIPVSVSPKTSMLSPRQHRRSFPNLRGKSKVAPVIGMLNMLGTATLE